MKHHINPHTRYEIKIDPASRWLAFAAAVLTMIMFVSVIWLATTTPGHIIPAGSPIRIPHVSVPTTDQIQQKVDQHNPVVQAAERRQP